MLCLTPIAILSTICTICLSFISFISFEHYFSGLNLLPLDIFYVNDVNVHFLILTNAIGALIMILSTRAILTAHRIFYIFLIIIFLCLNAFFMSDSVLSFYIFFEASAAPMFILIGLFGAGSTRHKAAYKFILYSLAGSIVLLPSLVALYNMFGTLGLNFITVFSFELAFEQMGLALAFFVPFSVKMPIMPFHLWLPEAHVEAPTSISVLLAGLLLKTGSFAFYLIIIYTFYQGAQLITPIALFLGVFSVVASSFYALVQTDIKKLIAYSSVSHMSLVLVALFTFTELGFKGGYLFMLAHGINSAALFSIVGVLYDRGHVRIIRAYNGLVLVMPLLVTIFFIMTLGNSGFPFTPGFFAEFFSFAGFTRQYPLASILTGVSIILSLIYSVWSFSRISFGDITFLKFTQDIEEVELVVLSTYLYAFTLMGFNTDIVCSIFTQPQLAMFNSSVVTPTSLDVEFFTIFLGLVLFGALVFAFFKPVKQVEKGAGLSLTVMRTLLWTLIVYFILQNLYNLFVLSDPAAIRIVEYVLSYPEWSTEEELTVRGRLKCGYVGYIWTICDKPADYLDAQPFAGIYHQVYLPAINERAQIVRNAHFVNCAYLSIFKTIPVAIAVFFIMKAIRLEKRRIGATKVAATKLEENQDV